MWLWLKLWLLLWLLPLAVAVRVERISFAANGTPVRDVQGTGDVVFRLASPPLIRRLASYKLAVVRCLQETLERAP